MTRPNVKPPLARLCRPRELPELRARLPVGPSTASVDVGCFLLAAALGATAEIQTVTGTSSRVGGPQHLCASSSASSSEPDSSATRRTGSGVMPLSDGNPSDGPVRMSADLDYQ